MGTFGQSFKREFGKNTGKWVSNKLFGDSYATPYKLIIQRERNERKQEREEAKTYKEGMLQLKRDERELERELQQRQLELIEQQREKIIEKNIKEVNDHNNYLDVIQSVHKDYGNSVDWKAIGTQDPPKPIKKSDELYQYYKEFTDKQVDEKKANLKSEYKLSYASLLLGKYYKSENVKIFQLGSSKVTAAIFYIFVLWLSQKNMSLAIVLGSIFGVAYFLLWIGSKDINKGIQLEEEINDLEANRKLWLDQYLMEQENAYEQYLTEKKSYHRIIDIANGVIARDTQSYIYAINFFDPFKDLKTYGADVSCSIANNNISVNFFPQGEEVIPRTFKRLTKRDIEIKEDWIPTSRFHEIYQDYICSCSLRIAKEIFALLPVDTVLINAKSMLLNSSNGMHEEKTILSIIADRAMLDRLNFNLLDPSESMRNFKYNMSFKKIDGFFPVEELKIADSKFPDDDLELDILKDLRIED